MSDDDTGFRFSRRKLLGSVATIGAAGTIGGASTTALLWDEEKFGDQENPNVLQAGELDLKVDWEGRYYNWMGETGYDEFSSDGQVDQPGPIIELEDVKPGDVLEVTQSAHVYGNPAFLGWHYQKHSESDNGINEPEDKVNGHDPDQSDGTEGGDLSQYMQVVIWYDDGDNLVDEVLEDVDDDDDGELDGDLEDYVMRIADVQNAAEAFGEADPVIYAGTLAGLDGANVRFNASMSNATDTGGDGTDDDDNLVAEEFGPYCYEASATEYIGAVAWIPRDIEGVNDNIIQTDRIEFQFGFDAIQCRHNVGPEGHPINGTISGADAENNANTPE